jgi:hypothetical protein
MKPCSLISAAIIFLLAVVSSHAAGTPVSQNDSATEAAFAKAVTQAPWAWRVNSKTIGHLTLLPDRTAIYQSTANHGRWVWGWKFAGASQLELINHKGKKTIVKLNTEMTEFTGPDHYGKLVIGRITKP